MNTTAIITVIEAAAAAVSAEESAGAAAAPAANRRRELARGRQGQGEFRCLSVLAFTLAGRPIKFKLRKMLNLTNQSMIRKKLTTVERYLLEAFRSACNQKSS